MSTPDKSICPKCEKKAALCVCSQITPLSTKLHVLILQHPQEPDKDLGSARLAHLSLKNSTLKIGLSWRNLSAALGREAIPSRWVVLHLGSGMKGKALRPGSLQFVDKKGVPQFPIAGQGEYRQILDGIIILDGTWSQAKTLWWRNAWLLKCKRGVLAPAEKSLYRELRKEPRRECLSTIESIAETLVACGESKTTGESLKKLFGELLTRYRELKSQKSS